MRIGIQWEKVMTFILTDIEAGFIERRCEREREREKEKEGTVREKKKLDS